MCRAQIEHASRRRFQVPTIRRVFRRRSQRHVQDAGSQHIPVGLVELQPLFHYRISRVSLSFFHPPFGFFFKRIVPTVPIDYTAAATVIAYSIGRQTTSWTFKELPKSCPVRISMKINNASSSLETDQKSVLTWYVYFH